MVDGARGREFGQKERKPRPTLPKEPTAEEFRAACAGAELHVVGNYEARGGNGAPVVVEVRPTAKPVVLVLTSYASVLWDVKVAAGLHGCPIGIMVDRVPPHAASNDPSMRVRIRIEAGDQGE